MSPLGQGAGRGVWDGGVVAQVDSGGAAERAGIAAGDTLVAADDQPLRDVIDWRWLADGACVEVTVRSGAEGVETQHVLTREPGETWGFAFDEPVFDGVRTCANRCAFCFVAQLPPGMRKSLRVRDDDFRLSFLHGNFITLTNLDDDDVDRIIEQHLSPLYVSVHSSDPEIRRDLIGAAQDRALDVFDVLMDARIEAHVQIVLVPGINDGRHLDDTLEWLSARKGVRSVGIVPMGFTSFQDRFTASFDARSAEKVVSQVEPYRTARRAHDGESWVHLADEFYLRAARAVPAAADYDGFPQYENGIGIVRCALDDLDAHAEELRAAWASLPPSRSVVLVTGEFAEPVLREAVARVFGRGACAEEGRLQVLGVRNSFFGGNVGVTGLLTAHDLVPALRGGRSQDVFLVPSVTVNSSGLLLDDVDVRDLATLTGRDVRLISCDADGLLGALGALAAERL